MPESVRKTKFFKYFLIIFLPLAAVLLASVLVFYHIQISPQQRILKQEEKDLVQSFTYEINNELENISNDIIVLSGLSSTRDYIRDPSVLIDAEKDFSNFCRAKKKYDQVRLLNGDGIEIIRVELKNNEVILLPRDKLQDKSQRYYFKNTIKLGPNQIYLSPFDLNIEYNKIEIPWKPMIRFATPVVFRGDKNEGVVVLNYLGKYILTKLNRDMAGHLGHYNLMTNKDGYWLKGFKAEDEYGFMFNRVHKFQNKFPVEWDIIGHEDKGQFETARGLFTFETVHPDVETQVLNEYALLPDEHYWKIITYVPSSVIYADSKRLYLLLIPFVFLFMALIFAASFMLAKSIQQRNDSRRELNEAAALKAKFASIAAHELKNPLAVIKEGVSLIFDGTLGEVSEKQKRSLAMVKREIDRMVRMAKDFLDFQKIQLKKMEFDFKENNLNLLIKALVDSIQPLASAKNIELRLELLEGIPEFKFDRDRLEQVLMNLLNNSLKFIKEGSVVISTELDGDEVHVRVIDTGPGIKRDELNSIFDAFKQSSTGSKVEGTGLGLFISKEIIQAHGGLIWVESEFGKGATFHFTIPVKR